MAGQGAGGPPDQPAARLSRRRRSTTRCRRRLPQVCRCLPWIANNYRLEELTSVPELRRNVSALFRKYQDVQVGAGPGAEAQRQAADAAAGPAVESLANGAMVHCLVVPPCCRLPR